MSRQSNYARNNFFKASMQRAQMLRKKKKDIQDIKNGNFVEPDPKNVKMESEDSVLADPEEVNNE